MGIRNTFAFEIFEGPDLALMKSRFKEILGLNLNESKKMAKKSMLTILKGKGKKDKTVFE